MRKLALFGILSFTSLPLLASPDPIELTLEQNLNTYQQKTQLVSKVVGQLANYETCYQAQVIIGALLSDKNFGVATTEAIKEEYIRIKQEALTTDNREKEHFFIMKLSDALLTFEVNLEHTTLFGLQVAAMEFIHSEIQDEANREANKRPLTDLQKLAHQRILKLWASFLAKTTVFDQSDLTINYLIGAQKLIRDLVLTNDLSVALESIEKGERPRFEKSSLGAFTYGRGDAEILRNVTSIIEDSALKIAFVNRMKNIGRLRGR